MIAIRLGFFETNSSSVHVLVIPKDTKISIPKTVHLKRGEYGWEDDEVYNTLDYFYQACVDAGIEELNKLFSYLQRKGVEEIHCKEIDDPGSKDVWPYSGYIDHSSGIPLDDLFFNESLLDRFLFGEDSFVKTGNDNVDDCPDENDYDPSIYDTIVKGN